MKNLRLYKCWKNIKQRCNNPNKPNYKYYGGKGIKVCKEWENFFVFEKWALENGYEEHLTIDRIDTNKNYEPSNCRWATLKEQANNKTNNRLITYKNITKTIHQWADEVNISAKTISMRLKRGWSLERALFEPAFIGKNQSYKKYMEVKNNEIQQI
jgi:hypothetical protein